MVPRCDKKRARLDSPFPYRPHLRRIGDLMLSKNALLLFIVHRYGLVFLIRLKFARNYNFPKCVFLADIIKEIRNQVAKIINKIKKNI